MMPPAGARTGRRSRTHDYVHLRHAAYRQVNGELDKHDELRVRLADITAWTFGRAEHKGA